MVVVVVGAHPDLRQLVTIMAAVGRCECTRRRGRGARSKRGRRAAGVGCGGSEARHDAGEVRALVLAVPLVRTDSAESPNRFLSISKLRTCGAWGARDEGARVGESRRTEGDFPVRAGREGCGGLEWGP